MTQQKPNNSRSEVSLGDRIRVLRVAEEELGTAAAKWLDAKAAGRHPRSMVHWDTVVKEREADVKRAARRLEETQKRLERRAA